MKNFKKIIAAIAAIGMAGTMLAACTSDSGSGGGGGGGGGGATPSETIGFEGLPEEIDEAALLADGGGSKLKIYCWNTEFMARMTYVYGTVGVPGKEVTISEKTYTTGADEEGNPVTETIAVITSINGVEIDFVVTPNQGNAYQDKLDADIVKNTATDDPIDMYLIEADYAMKYVNTEFSLDVSLLGLTNADVGNMYGYTKDVTTNNTDGTLRGVSWQACPGAFIYRRSIAQDVWATDDMTEIQAKVANWDLFEGTAAELKEKGYFMLSGYDDSYRAFSNNATNPWVDANNTIQIDDKIGEWVEQTKTFTDNGWNNRANLWSDASMAGFNADGKIFGYFGPAWFIDFVMAGKGSDGDWAAVEGPASFNWGGSWLVAAPGTDNAALVQEVLRDMTCNEDNLLAVTKEFGEFTNNRNAMEALAADESYSNSFLGGQNHIAVLAKSATNISMDNISEFDQLLTESFQAAMMEYFNGNNTQEESIELFYEMVLKNRALNR
ncbi:MAG: carbohydrate ABC transporter substrate-binding protein [Oscillospiraceae bacterium]|nr:carbohydrate ABC transporter substrate-binding protein [Oscillospiraceae bacterium]